MELNHSSRLQRPMRYRYAKGLWSWRQGLNLRCLSTTVYETVALPLSALQHKKWSPRQDLNLQYLSMTAYKTVPLPIRGTWAKLVARTESNSLNKFMRLASARRSYAQNFQKTSCMLPITLIIH